MRDPKLKEGRTWSKETMEIVEARRRMRTRIVLAKDSPSVWILTASFSMEVSKLTCEVVRQRRCSKGVRK